MKYITLFLIMPLLCNSQTYSELMQITSEQSYIRYMVENGYSESESDSEMIRYRLYSRKNGGTKDWRVESRFDKSREFDIIYLFYDFDFPTAKNKFDNIFNSIKANCDFVGVRVAISAVCYSCNWKGQYRREFYIDNDARIGSISFGAFTFKPDYKNKF